LNVSEPVVVVVEVQIQRIKEQAGAAGAAPIARKLLRVQVAIIILVLGQKAAVLLMPADLGEIVGLLAMICQGVLLRAAVAGARVPVRVVWPELEEMLVLGTEILSGVVVPVMSGDLMLLGAAVEKAVVPQPMALPLRVRQGPPGPMEVMVAMVVLKLLTEVLLPAATAAAAVVAARPLQQRPQELVVMRQMGR
jgi:hypothetical protein